MNPQGEELNPVIYKEPKASPFSITVRSQNMQTNISKRQIQKTRLKRRVQTADKVLVIVRGFFIMRHAK
jgi:hypothetical protein